MGEKQDKLTHNARDKNVTFHAMCCGLLDHSIVGANRLESNRTSVLVRQLYH